MAGFSAFRHSADENRPTQAAPVLRRSKTWHAAGMTDPVRIFLHAAPLALLLATIGAAAQPTR